MIHTCLICLLWWDIFLVNSANSFLVLLQPFQFFLSEDRWVICNRKGIRQTQRSCRKETKNHLDESSQEKWNHIYLPLNAITSASSTSLPHLARTVFPARISGLFDNMSLVGMMLVVPSHGKKRAHFQGNLRIFRRLMTNATTVMIWRLLVTDAWSRSPLNTYQHEQKDRTPTNKIKGIVTGTKDVANDRILFISQS